MNPNHLYQQVLPQRSTFATSATLELREQDFGLYLLEEGR